MAVLLRVAAAVCLAFGSAGRSANALHLKGQPSAWFLATLLRVYAAQ